MAGEIKVNITGLAQLVSSIDRLKSRLETSTRQATSDSASLLQSTAVSKFNSPPAPFTRTGNLQRSIKTTSPVANTGIGRYSVRVGPTAIYSRIIELGGTIHPHSGKMLSWVGPDGKRVFARSVTIRPHPYFEPSYREMVDKMRPLFANAWRKALET